MRLWVFVLLLICAGCARPIQYSVETMASKDEALRLVDRLLREQPEKYLPESFDVQKDHFFVIKSDTRRSLLVGGVATVPISQSVYFDNVSSIRLLQRKSIYIVELSDQTGTPIFHYYHHDIVKAHKFADAVNTLSRGAATSH